jgi:hypothetical protein
MPDPTSIHYASSEDHIVRRLGAAVLSMWDELSREHRTEIIRRALAVNDRYYSEDLQHELRAFLEAQTGQSAPDLEARSAAPRVGPRKS